jgi:uncharacterized protein (DUF736 family)
MADQYDDTNRGAIFKNDKTSDNQPDYTGKINVDGVEKRIALWIRESKSGTKYMSASISDPQPRAEEPARAEQPVQLADAIPF